MGSCFCGRSWTLPSGGPSVRCTRGRWGPWSPTSPQALHCPACSRSELTLTYLTGDCGRPGATHVPAQTDLPECTSSGSEGPLCPFRAAPSALPEGD